LTTSFTPIAAKPRVVVVWHAANRHLTTMCGRVIQSSGPLRYGIVEGMDIRDSRAHNYPRRWNAAPSQDLLVIRRNHETGEVSLDPLRWGTHSPLVSGPKGRTQAERADAVLAQLLAVLDEMRKLEMMAGDQSRRKTI
jgi:hypothetical protein